MAYKNLREIVSEALNAIFINPSDEINILSGYQDNVHIWVASERFRKIPSSTCEDMVWSALSEGPKKLSPDQLERVALIMTYDPEEPEYKWVALQNSFKSFAKTPTDSVVELPACCTAGPDASRAERMYAAYNAAGDPTTAGLNYQGKPCPTWVELPVNVRAKWLAASRVSSVPTGASTFLAIDTARVALNALESLSEKMEHSKSILAMGMEALNKIQEENAVLSAERNDLQKWQDQQREAFFSMHNRMDPGFRMPRIKEGKDGKP